MAARQHSSSALALSVTSSPNARVAALFLALAAPTILSVLVFKAQLVLPSLSAISLGIAGMVALLAWATATRSDSTHATLWDLSGLYACLGFAAGMLSEPQHVVEFFMPTGEHAGR